MRKFLMLAIIFLLFIAVIPVYAETTAIDIGSDINEGYLKGTNVGNKLSFEIKFNLDQLPENANIISSQLTYSQSGISAGLVRFIDKYTTDTIDSRSLNSTDTQIISNIVPYLRRWQKSSSQNLGILASGATLAPDDDVTIRDFKLQIIYDLPDTTAPQIYSTQVAEFGATYARIVVETNELTSIAVSYGKTSLYDQSIRADNTIFNTKHEILLEQLVSGTTVHFKVTVTDSAGNKSSSNDLTFETTSDSATQIITRIDTALSAPQNLKADIVYATNSAHISLSWQSVPEQSVKGYTIYRASTSGNTNGLSSGIKYKEYATIEDRNNTFVDYGVELGQKYFYYVRSYSENVISPKSASQSVDLPKSIPNQSGNEPATTQILLIIVASAALILFAFYILIRLSRQIPNKQKNHKLVNVLKDPDFYTDVTNEDSKIPAV